MFIYFIIFKYINVLIKESEKLYQEKVFQKPFFSKGFY